jgi:hypothetical protein
MEGNAIAVTDALLTSSTDLYSHEEYVESEIVFMHQERAPPQSEYNNPQIPVTFPLNNMGENHWLKLDECRYRGRFRVLDNEGKVLPDTEKIAIINSAQSMIDKIEILINGNIVSDLSQIRYSIKSYLETLLSCSKGSTNHLSPLALWYMDEPGKHNLVELEGTNTNSGFVARNKLIKGSKWCYFNLPLHIDIFQIRKLWPSGLNLQVRIYRSSPNFILMSGESNKTYQIEYSQLELEFSKCTLNPKIQQAHQLRLVNKNMHIDFDKVVIYETSLKENQTLVNIPNLYQGALPTILLAVIIKTEALSGSLTTNPLCFEHLNVKEYCLRINGIQHPTFAIRTDFKPDGDTTEAYARLYDVLKLGRGTREHFVTMEHFKGGCFIMPYDISVDSCLGQHRHPPTQGIISMHFQFEKGLVDAYTLIVYASFQDFIEVDSNNHVFLSTGAQIA